MGNALKKKRRLEMYTVMIQPEDGDSFDVHLCETEEQFKLLTVQDLWTKISEASKTEDYDPDDCALIFKGKRLPGNTLLSKNGIRHRSVIRLIHYKFYTHWHLSLRSVRIIHVMDEDPHKDKGRWYSMDRLADFNSKPAQ